MPHLAQTSVGFSILSPILHQMISNATFTAMAMKERTSHEKTGAAVNDPDRPIQRRPNPPNRPVRTNEGDGKRNRSGARRKGRRGTMTNESDQRMSGEERRGGSGAGLGQDQETGVEILNGNPRKRVAETGVGALRLARSILRR